MLSSHAVAVLILSPEGIPLVRDPKKPVPRYWKLPGGRSEGSETAEECAVREVWQETGLTIEQSGLETIERQYRGSHIWTIFKIQVSTLHGLKTQGDEQEEISTIPSVKDIVLMDDFFPNHRDVLRKFEL